MDFIKPLNSASETLKWLRDTMAGPICITIGSSYMLVGAICFFDVVAPTFSYPLISIPICLLVALNMFTHYFYAITISPGFLDEPPRDSGNSLLWARNWARNLDKGEKTMTRGASWSEKGVKITPASTTECKKCKKVRPERSHHCSTCNKCVLKYDHHCPVRVNQCVGLHNERHFFLFMVNVVISTLTLNIVGFQEFIHAFIHSLGITLRKWEHNIPEYVFVHIYVASAVICCAVSLVMLSTLHGVIYSQTVGEGYVNQDYREEAKERNEEYINSYDCGKLKNLQFFFKIEGRYSILTFLLPLRLNPYTDGFSWARKDGYEDYPSFRKAKPRETMTTRLYNLISFYLSF